ncbi:hypothetical protein ACS0TY_020201 [Phlomoides rotata]
MKAKAIRHPVKPSLSLKRLKATVAKGIDPVKQSPGKSVNLYRSSSDSAADSPDFEGLICCQFVLRRRCNRRSKSPSPSIDRVEDAELQTVASKEIPVTGSVENNKKVFARLIFRGSINEYPCENLVGIGVGEIGISVSCLRMNIGERNC